MQIVPNSTANQPYTVHFDMSIDVLPPNNQFAIPVYHGKRKQFQGNIAGFRAESDTIEELGELMRWLLINIINMARTPTYVFVARTSKRVYPVYTLGDEVFVTTPGGPTFRHVELAKAREYLGNYLHEIGEIGDEGAETLHVRGVHRRTLALIRPIFYLKKRIVDQTDFWAPVFPSLTGQSIYTYAASERREQPVTTGMEVLNLTYIVASGLMANERLSERYHLRPDRLLPAWWQRLESHSKRLPQVIRVDQDVDPNLPDQLSLYEAPYLTFALDPRRHENRPSLYLGESVEEIRAYVAQDYLRKGLIESADVVQLV